jgi:MATE family multidrug resistance protein
MQATDTHKAETAGPVSQHVRQTIAIALPIAAALLSEMGMGLISTTMLGGLGDRALAAGALATNVFFSVLLVLQGALSGVGVLAANRLGAGQPREVPGLYWSGVALAVALAVPMVALLSLPARAWTALGLAPVLANDVASYLHILRWAVPGGMVGVGMMRQFLPAIGLERVLLWVLPGGVVLHAALTHWLIDGGAGLPPFGLAGSAAAIVATLTILAIGMLAVLHGPRFGSLVRWARPDARMLRALLGIGLPVAAMVAVEAGLFLVTGIVAGVLGPSVLAAHMIALSVASVCFMVPLAISQAANVRVASAHGAGNLAAARRAGFCAIGLSLTFMATTAFVLSNVPALIVRLYLAPPSAPAAAGAAATAALAARLLRVASVFQLADGTQVAAAGALRGLQDVRVPTVLATFGYWGLGFWAGLWLAFREQLGVVGLWWGLCVGLAVVAVGLTARFAQLSAPRAHPAPI